MKNIRFTVPVKNEQHIFEIFTKEIPIIRDNPFFIRNRFNCIDLRPISGDINRLHYIIHT